MSANVTKPEGQPQAQKVAQRQPEPARHRPDSPVVIGERLAELQSRPFNPCPPIPREAKMQMTKADFTKLHGGPALTLQRYGATTMYLRDGATMGHDGTGPTYNPPPANKQDRLLNQLTWTKRLWFLTEQQLANVNAARLQSGPSMSVRYQMSGLQWDEERFGPAPLGEGRELDFDRATAILKFQIFWLKKRFYGLRDQLQQINPNLVIEDRFLTS